ncbi:MAG: PDZ domain-containing protein [Acidobacteria bacterium]|nr:PDZ domain-containing protein [Acidobacteriota bacterium]
MRSIRHAGIPYLIVTLALWSARLFAQSVESPYVRVLLTREFPGVVVKGRLVPQTRVRETAEFNGCAVGNGNLVLSYIGSYGPEFHSPAVQVDLETSEGQKIRAQLVGVDERISVAVLQTGATFKNPLVWPDDEETAPQQPSIVTFGPQKKWSKRAPALFHFETDPELPEQEMHVSAPARVQSGDAPTAAFVVDQEEKLVGLVSAVELHPLDRQIHVCQILPSALLRESTELIMEGNRSIKAGWLGILLHPDEEKGSLPVAPIRSVVRGSPAEQAGLESGDVIVRIGTRALKSTFDLVRNIRWKGAGSLVELGVERNGKLHTVTVRLTERQDQHPGFSWGSDPGSPDSTGPASASMLRLYRTLLPPHIGVGLELQPSPLVAGGGIPSGLMVSSVVRGSAAQKAGFRKGDVLIQINGRLLLSLDDAMRAVDSKENSVSVRLIRDGHLHTLLLGVAGH